MSLHTVFVTKDDIVTQATVWAVVAQYGSFHKAKKFKKSVLSDKRWPDAKHSKMSSSRRGQVAQGTINGIPT